MIDYSDFNYQVYRRTVGVSLNQNIFVFNNRLYQSNGSEITAADNLFRINAVSNNAASRLIADIRFDTTVILRQIITNQNIAFLDNQLCSDKDDAINNSNQQSTNLENIYQSTENLSLSSCKYSYFASQNLKLLYQNISKLIEISNTLYCSS